MRREAGLLDTIGKVYDAAMDPDCWPGALSAIADGLGADTGVIYLVDTAKPEVGFLKHARLDDALLSQYTDYYVTLDPWVDLLARRAPGKAYVSQEALSDAAFDKTEFCNDLCRPLGIFHSLGGFVKTNGHAAVLCGMERARSKGPFGAVERRGLEALFPHLSRAAQLHRTFHGLQGTVNATTAVMDRLPQATLVLDANGHIVQANRLAEAVLAAQDGLCVQGGRLGATAAKDNAAVRRLVQEAAATACGKGTGAGGALSISRPSLGRPYALLVSPLVPNDGNAWLDAAASLPAVLVLIGDPERRVELPTDALQSLHGLTPAEARLTAALAAGERLNDIAERFGIAKNTARAQLKTVFAKTGANGQADLVRLVLSGVGQIVTSETNGDGTPIDE